MNGVSSGNRLSDPDPRRPRNHADRLVASRRKLQILKWPVVSRSVPANRHLPGEAGIWILIFGDVIVFSLFFIVFIEDFGRASELFRQSQARLNQSLAAINTILLLSSSWLVATAVEAARREKGRINSSCLLGAFACGLGFAIVKFFEWKEKFNRGITMMTNDFYMYYYMFTGIHLLHVLIGLGVLLFLVRYTWDSIFDSRRISVMECGACYWHMVDLLWIGLFALLYLVK